MARRSCSPPGTPHTTSASTRSAWTKTAAGWYPVPVTRSAANDSQPDWSPKGDLIAFRRSGRHRRIFVVPATGGVERPLTDFGYLPQWSPDGQRILFTNMLVNHLSDSFWIVTSGQDRSH